MVSIAMWMAQAFSDMLMTYGDSGTHSTNTLAKSWRTLSVCPNGTLLVLRCQKLNFEFRAGAQELRTTRALHAFWHRQDGMAHHRPCFINIKPYGRPALRTHLLRAPQQNTCILIMKTGGFPVGALAPKGRPAVSYSPS